MRYTGTPFKTHCFIDNRGEEITPLPAWADNAELLIGFYRSMVLARVFDQKSVALQRTGQIGTFPSCLGQEAVSTGIGFALRPDDVFAPYYRDMATQYLRGVKLEQLLLYWGGDERGSLFEGAAARDLPICVPIANQITHAAGVASALKIRGRHDAVLASCGDGATSRGDFLETLNVAGAWQLPLVIVINNNQWAISVPRALQSHAATLAQKADSAGIEGFQVDGNDVCAVYDAVYYALDKARHGKGATLIEAVTYRLGDHTTADDASRYRTPEEVKAAWQREPVKRLQIWLHRHGFWDEQQERDWQAACADEVQTAVSRYLDTTAQQINDLTDYLFAIPPSALDTARRQLQRRAARHGGDHGHPRK